MHVCGGLIRVFMVIAWTLLIFLVHELCSLVYSFLQFKDGVKIYQINPSQTLKNLQCCVTSVIRWGSGVSTALSYM